MINVYFGENGLTSTSASYYANIAKELQNAAAERLNSVKFFKTSVAVIGSNERQLMSDGNKTLDFIEKDLETLSAMNAFCAWVREAIKEKEEQQRLVNKLDIESWAKQQGIEIPVQPKHPKDPDLISELDVIESWDINKRSKYLDIEAKAATIGKQIHPEGALSKARKKAHTAVNNPITKEGTGRDMILYYTEETVSLKEVDNLFMYLQDKYRSYEKELNQMKAEIKETVNDLTRKANEQYQKEVDEWKAANHEFSAAWSTIRTQYNTWRTNELERISKLKITIPNRLKETFNLIKAIGDTSK